MRNLLDHYLLALRHEAHRSFPADRAEEIVTEIQTHLEDRVESTVRDGISRPIAEADALNDFGPVRKLLRGFLYAAYETPFARCARLITFCLVTVVALIFTFSYAFFTRPEQFARQYPVPLPTWFAVVFYLGMIALVIGGLLGRRPQTKKYALVWCGAVMLTTLQVGINVANLRDTMPGAKAEWSIPATIHRNQLSREIEISQKYLESAKKEVRLLEMGMQTFSQAKWSDAPAELKVGDTYLLPGRGTPGLRRSAFVGPLGSRILYYAVPSTFPRYIYLEERELSKRRMLTSMVRTIQSEQAVVQARMVNTPDRIQSQKVKRELQMLKGQELQLQAKLAAYMPGEYIRGQWMKYGPNWLIAKRKAVEREKWLLSAYASIEQSPGFNMAAVLHRVLFYFLPAMGSLALLLGTDFIAASIGRFFHRLRREWEWRITAARVR